MSPLQFVGVLSHHLSDYFRCRQNNLTYHRRSLLSRRIKGKNREISYDVKCFLRITSSKKQWGGWLNYQLLEIDFTTAFAKFEWAHQISAFYFTLLKPATFTKHSPTLLILSWLSFRWASESKRHRLERVMRFTLYAWCSLLSPNGRSGKVVLFVLNVVLCFLILQTIFSGRKPQRRLHFTESWEA